MGKQKWFAMFVLAALLLSAVLPPVMAQEALPAQVDTIVAPQKMADQGIDEPYQFPIVPGSPVWETFTTHQDMLDATQVPDNVLESLSTTALIRTVMDYPLLGDMYLYNTVQQGFDATTRQFHALQALIARDDVGTKALEEYLTFSAIAISTRSDQAVEGQTARERFYETLKLHFVETVLAQDSILGSLTAEQKQTLFRAASNRLAQVQKNIKELGPAAQESPLWLIGKLLRKEDLGFARRVQEDEALSRFLEGGFNANDQILNEIQGVAQGKLDSVSVGPHAPTALAIQPDDYSVTWVKTPNGSTVPGTEQTTYELMPGEITGWNNYVQVNYPCATRLRDATRRYNCHSYAWYSQVSWNTIWMYHPGDDIYWGDGSYTFSKRIQYACVGPNAAPNGAKVSYEWDDHSAIYYTNGWMQSKWGVGPLVQHNSACVPYNSSSLAFYVR